MECTELAQQTAEAFLMLFDLGSVYGAAIFFVGYLVGSWDHWIDRLISWRDRRRPA